MVSGSLGRERSCYKELFKGRVESAGEVIERRDYSDRFGWSWGGFFGGSPTLLLTKIFRGMIKFIKRKEAYISCTQRFSDVVQ